MEDILTGWTKQKPSEELLQNKCLALKLQESDPQKHVRFLKNNSITGNNFLERIHKQYEVVEQNNPPK